MSTICVCSGRGLTPAHICPGTGLAPATSAPGPGSALAHICTGTGITGGKGPPGRYAGREFRAKKLAQIGVMGPSVRADAI